MENRNERFEYTYSAKQQDEIERIRQKYIAKETDELAELRRLDAEVTKPGTITAMVLGVVGTLIFGSAMSLALVWTDTMLVPGIVAGIIGFVMLAAAYPVYVKVTEKQKEKLAPQILELTEKLIGK